MEVDPTKQEVVLAELEHIADLFPTLEQTHEFGVILQVEREEELKTNQAEHQVDTVLGRANGVQQVLLVKVVDLFGATRKRKRRGRNEEGEPNNSAKQSMRNKKTQFATSQYITAENTYSETNRSC